MLSGKTFSSFFAFLASLRPLRDESEIKCAEGAGEWSGTKAVNYGLSLTRRNVFTIRLIRDIL